MYLISGNFHQPLAGEGQKAKTPEEIPQELILLQAYQARGWRSTEVAPEHAEGHTKQRMCCVDPRFYEYVDALIGFSSTGRAFVFSEFETGSGIHGYP